MTPKMYEVFQQADHRWYFIMPGPFGEDCLVGPYNKREDAEAQVSRVRPH